MLIGDLLISNFAKDKFEAGDDVLYGGAGDDLILGDGIADKDALDSQKLSRLLTDPVGVLTEKLTGTYAEGEDPDDAADDAAKAKIRAKAARGGDDKLYGGSGDDIVLGEGGDDTLDGGAGDDLVAGGTGADLGIWSGPSLESASEPESGDPATKLPNGSKFSIGQRDFYHGNGLNLTKSGGQYAVRDSQTDAGADGPNGTRDTLRLVLTEKQFGNADIVAELRKFIDFLKVAGNDAKLFEFKTLPLSAIEWENVEFSLKGFEDLVLTNLIVGTGDDLAVGTDANDLFVGTDGPDSFIGEAGDDLALGGKGADSLVGDYVGNPTGAFGDDKLFGGAGQDILTGDLAGNDMLKDSKGGDDRLDGGDGDDYIFGDGGNSMRNGAVGGDDTIFGGGGRDKISGDATMDLRDGAKGGDDRIEGDGDGPFALIEESKSVSTAPNARVPSSGSGGSDSNNAANITSSELKVSGFKGKISDLNLKLNLTHVWVHDLIITLISPKGTEVRVAFIPSGAIANSGLYANVTFDDDSGVPFSPSSDKRTLRPLNPLSAFDGEDPNGTWRLRIHDSDADGTGTLRNWGLEIKAKAPPPFDDNLVGDAGNAIIESTGGNDTIYGGKGADSVSGDAGGDLLKNARGGGDRLYGGDGDDVLVGDAHGKIGGGSRGGDDRILGGAGNDEITGDAGGALEGAGSRGGDDKLFGGDGDDDIFGDVKGDLKDNAAAGNDDLYGGDGDDFLVGDAGGNRGTVLALDSAGDDRLYGGKGSDILIGDSGEGTGGASAIREDLKNKDAEALNAHRDRENGTGGNDTLDGGAGDDAVFGGAGSDLAIFTGGESDFDYYDGGGSKEGTDQDGSSDTLRLLLTAEQLADQSVIDEIKAFLAHIKGTGAGKGDDAVFEFKTLKLFAVEFEALQIGLAGFPDRYLDATDPILGTGDGLAVGTAAGDFFIGTDGADSFIGNAGDDLALGFKGADSLVGDYAGNPTGALGDDTLFGGAGQDTLTGDLAGNDMLKDSRGGDDTLHGGDGDDRIFGDGGNSMRNGAVGGDDRIFGGGGSDKISGDAAGDLRDGAKGGDDFIEGDGDGPFGPIEESKSVSASPNRNIPDAGTLSSTLEVQGFEGKISDLNLKLNITHSYHTDLIITLTSPRGTEVRVAAHSGNLTSSTPRYSLYNSVTFDDDGGGVRIESARQGDKNLLPLNPLSAFDGEDPNGTWTLRVIDRSIYDTGALRSWGLEIEAVLSFDDNLVGDAGNAIVESTGGNDEIFGDKGDDSVSGDAGGDLLKGSQGGDDVLYGGDGKDIVSGDAHGKIGGGSRGGDDRIFGGAGNDEITGDAGGALEGEGSRGGDDKLFGGSGDDDLFGDAKGDLKDGAAAGNDDLHGGKGSDVLIGDSGAGTGGGSAIRADLKNKDAAALAAHRDREKTTGGDDTLDGGAGDDAVFGGAGSDLAIFTAGAGDFDYYDGGGGKEGTDRDGSTDTLRLLLTAEQFADRAVIDELRAFLAHIEGTGAGKGDDAVFEFKTLKLSAVEFEALQIGFAGFPDRYLDLTPDSLDKILGQAGADSFTGTAGDDIFSGFGGDDLLRGDPAKGDSGGGDPACDKLGDDLLFGGDHDDRIAGDAGGSMIRSSGGGDLLHGGRGGDRISGDAAGDLRDGSKGGDDRIEGDGDGPFGPGGESKSVSASPNLPVPSSGDGGGPENPGSNSKSSTVSTLVVSGFTGDISDLDLRLNITHSAPKDLKITLIAPDGTEVVVALAQISVSSDVSYAGVTFDDDGRGVPIRTAKPSDTNLLPVNPLSAFDGKDPNGTWTLRIYDGFPGDSGTLVRWGLDIETAPISFDDTITGDAGNAIVDSAGGNDEIFGGQGNDSVSGDAGGDIESGGSGGDDTLYGGGDNDKLIGDAGGVIKGTGSKGGDDALYGGDGNDTLYGDAVGDIGAGASGGDDTLEGGAGDDTLYGDAAGSVAGTGGKDTFLFNLGEATGDDVIKDYDLDDDTLRFDDVLGAADGDKIAALEKIVNVKEEGNDVIITRTDGKGTIRIEGIAGAGDFDSVQDLADATNLQINA